MKYKRKFLHLLFAVRKSLLILSFSVLLIVISYVMIISYDQNEVVSFAVGIIASVIATLVFKISDKYEKSISACTDIANAIEEMVLYLERMVTRGCANYEYCSTLWLYYSSICRKSANLTYEEEFNRVSIIINDLIKLVKENADIKEIYEAKEKLVDAKRLFQFV